MSTVEFQWLEHLWNHENMFETGIVRANECSSQRKVRKHNKDIFSIFCNMTVCCVFSLESPRYTIFNIKKKITLNYSKSGAIGCFPRDSTASSKQPW